MKRYFILIFILLLGGCASKLSLSPADKEHIKTIAIAKSVHVPDEMWYTGPEATFGVVGLLVEKSTTKMEDKIKALAKENDIYIDQIVYQTISGYMSSLNGYTVVEEGEQAADATMTIDIDLYGLALAHGFSSKLNPMLRLTMRLNDRSGKVISKSVGYYSGGSVTPVTLESIKADPKELGRVWQDAANFVVSKTLVGFE